MKRGWFTYTDLCVLLEQSSWSQALTAIYQHFTKVKKLYTYTKFFSNVVTFFYVIHVSCEQN